MKQMESFNVYKGYGQLHHLNTLDSNKSHFSNPKKPKLFLIIASLILLSLLIGSLIGVIISHPQTNNATHSIQLVCNVTQHPDSCFTTLSSLNTRSNPDPEFLFPLSLRAAMAELFKAATLPELLSRRVSDSRTQSALKDCESLFNDALYKLNQSATAAEGHVASFPKVRINDLKTWISAAMTDQETCLDGLEEMESTVVDEVKTKLKGSKVCMSNSLAILANINHLVEKFHHPSSEG